MSVYNYEQAVEYLLKIPAFAKKNSFDNTKSFFHELGKFEKLNNVIHVAGTNGKGSVCAFVQSCLVRAGYKVGMFTSPHLISINERIRIDGEEISNDIFLEAFTEVKEFVDKRTQRGCTHPAFFEFIFAMACVIFSKFKLDYIILETGLGGRLDATNIVEKPLVTAITSISYDHTQYLGETISEIAYEKAGIIKHGVPVVFDGDNEIVKTVIEKKATINCSQTLPVYEKNVKILKISEKHIDFLIKYGYDKSICINLNSNALYQTKNVYIAVLILHILKDKIDDYIIKYGIEDTVWHGRMEWIKPYFLIDGAHNRAGIESVVNSLKIKDKNILLLFSAVSDKNYFEMVEKLCTELTIKEVIITELSVNRRVIIEELKDLFDIHYNGKIYVEREVSQAVLLAEQHIKNYGDAIIFATGSLYLVSEIISLYKGD